MQSILDRLNAALAGRYAIESEIGRGGMAVVFLAEDLRHHRQVAIKVLDPALSATLGADRFLNEIETAARLDHPHIVPLYDSGAADGLLYYVMPFVAGESLRESLEREGQLPVDEALRIATEVADGLAYAHEHGVVHRDIKPDNILLSAGHARIADFGLARAIDLAARDRATATGLVAGTPVYMAPEQASGQGRADERSDIYSVGCLLYEMLVGEPPFSGLTPQTLLARKMSESAPRIRPVRDAVSQGLDDVVSRCLSRTPADRFRTATDLQIALRDPDGRTGRTVPVRRSRRGLALAATLVVAGLLAVLLLKYAGTLSSGTDPDSAGDLPSIRSLMVLPIRNFSEAAEQEHIAAGFTDALITSLAAISAFEIVIGRRTAMEYQGVDKSLQEVARERGVDALLEGSVTAYGDTLYARLRLVHGPTDRLLWSDEYSEDSGNVLGLQQQVSRDVVNGIQIALSPIERDRLARETYSPDPQALEAYLRGRLHTSRYTPEDAVAAQGYYAEAIRLDPEFALAQAALAMGVCNILPSLTEERAKSAPMFQACEESALKAVALDDGLSDAHAALAMAKIVEWDWIGAEEEFRRAVELNPNAAGPRQWYGWFLAQMMRFEEALDQARTAERLDPLNPMTRILVVATLMNQRRYDEAHVQLDNVLQDHPEHSGAFIYKAAIYNLQGRPAEALDAANRIGEGVPQAVALRGWSYALLGEDDRAREIVMRRDSLLGDYGAGYNALISLAYGREEEALDQLERAYAARATWLPNTTSWPHFDAIRDHPRFIELRRKMGLE